MLKQGICRPSKSAWSSPLHLVQKRNGDWRPCGDYRRLNSITIPDRYPLPHIHDIAQRLNRRTFFSTIALIRAYFYIPIEECDILKTAVTTPFRLFEFTVMPFGLRNAAQSFQRFMHEVLRNLDFCDVYLDDILVSSTSVSEHYTHLSILFGKLKSTRSLLTQVNVFGKKRSFVFRKFRIFGTWYQT